MAAWNALPAGRTGVIVIMDSVSEHDAPGAPALPLEIRIGERSRLLIVAGRWPRESQEGEGSAPGMGEADAGASLVRRAGTVDASGVRAHLIGDVRVQGTAPAGTSDGGACVINGLLLEGRLDVAAGNLGQLVLSHCSVVTGVEGVAAPSALVVQPGGNAQLALRIERSICPAVAVADPIRAVSVIDSLIGGQAMADAAPCLAASRTPTTLLRSTFFGPVDVQSLSASDCIFAAGVQAARRQTGCVRFSYVPAGSAVPRRYRCQPDLEIAARGPRCAPRSARPCARCSCRACMATQASGSSKPVAPCNCARALKVAPKWAPSNSCINRNGKPTCAAHWTNTCASVWKPA
ncbi:hypothetical protein [Pigmentiphaga litoralis]|uniref:hypothetical protein n=1 Tax=Pigmentiphaga litoralis TaxID=516702 RepID=UPI003B43ACB6